jgi:arylsulfatase A-like enzyme
LPEDLALYDDLPAKYQKPVKLTSNETGGQTTRPQGEVLRERYAEITAMDRAIGTLRAHLAAQSLRDNTLVFYCGDNGTSSDAALGFPHRAAKGSLYEGGTLVPGVLEWPARIARPRVTGIRASTSDLLPTLAALTGQPLPPRPLDGMDLAPVLDGKMTERPAPLCFWEFHLARPAGSKPRPYLDPALQEGTTPLVKKAGTKNTRDFLNWRHPVVTEDDYRGARSIIVSDHKLVLHETQNASPKVELFDLKTDPAEKRNLAADKPSLAQNLQARLREWQSSVLQSLTGADYYK